MKSFVVMVSVLLLLDRGLPDVIELRKCPREIRVALRLDPSLIRQFPVLGVDLVDDLHAGDDLAEWGKALSVKSGVVFEIDEHLGRPGSRAGGRKCDVPPLIAFLHRIIGDVGVPPD